MKRVRRGHPTLTLPCILTAKLNFTMAQKQAICSVPQCLSIPYLSSSLFVDHIMFCLSVSGSTFYHLGNYNRIRSVEKFL